MAMKQIIYACLFMMALGLVSCYDDEGNYDYHDINEITFGTIDSVFNVLMDTDTLKIEPVINMTDGDFADTVRYKYAWVIFTDANDKDTISTQRVLNYPVKILPGTYNLWLKIKDLETEVVWKKEFSVTVGTPYSKGILLVGEEEDGFVDISMISMAGTDTIIYKNLLKDTDLTSLTGPIAFLHTGGNIFNYESNTKVWLFTESGSYYLDRTTLQGDESNVFEDLLLLDWNEPMIPVNMASEQKNINGDLANNSKRAFVCSNGYLFFNSMWIGGDYYGEPINCLQSNTDELFPASRYLFYSINSFNNLIWYDTENDRFFKAVSEISNYSELLPEKESNLFPWDQKGTGRKLIYGENTWNTDGGSVDGNSFALMSDGTNAFIYKFYPNSLEQRALYEVLPLATGFLQADAYAFSSTRTVVFYVFNDQLYAYDYNPGHESLRVIPLETTGEITMIKFDLTMEPKADALWIATYNSQDGGTLQKYYVGNNPNMVELNVDPDAVYTGLNKVRNMSWRAKL